MSAGLLVLGASTSHAKGIRPGHVVELSEMIENRLTAAQAIPRLREVIADSLDAERVPLLRGLLLTALIKIHAPIPEIVNQADTLDGTLIEGDPRRLTFLSMAAEELVGRGKEPGQAVRLAKLADAVCPKDPQYAAECSKYQTLLGRALMMNRETEAAISTLSMAAAAAPDSQIALYYLGRAQEKAGRVDEAISSYVRSLGVFTSGDSLAWPPLRALYRKRHGSLDGLAAKVAEALATATRQLALDNYRHEAPAPDWTLPDLEAKTIRSSDYGGKVLLVVFWTSSVEQWGNALFATQNLYRDYKDRGVAVQTINWEQGLQAEARFDLARQAVMRVGVRVPVAVDDPHTVFDAYGVRDVPVFFLIDREGRIRYRVSGLPDNIEAVLAAQIESLLRPAK